MLVLFEKIFLISILNLDPVVVAWKVKALVSHSVDSSLCAFGGSNPVQVWCINRSEVETLCRKF